MSDIRVTLTGTGYPRPWPGVAGPGVLVEAAGERWQVDCGRGSVMRLCELGILPHQLTGLLLTHFHSDHITDLPDMLLSRWLLGPDTTPPLKVAGAFGASTPVTFAVQFLGHDLQRRADHAGKRSFQFPDIHEFDSAPSITRLPISDEVAIFSRAVTHGYVREAVGYRFEYRGCVVAISGDTTECDGVVELARDADLLVHEILDEPRLLELAGPGSRPYIIDYHSTAEQVGRMATQAGVKHLVLTHIIPALRNDADAENLRAQVAAHFSGRITVGRDLTSVELEGQAQ